MKERREWTLLDISEVLRKTSLKGRAVIYRMVEKHEFPTPVRVSARRVAWPAHAVDEWIAERVKRSAGDGWRDPASVTTAKAANAKSVAVRVAQRATRNKSEAKPKGQRKIASAKVPRIDLLKTEETDAPKRIGRPRGTTKAAMLKRRQKALDEALEPAG
jgi:predicted DNA-binding transcriptional regulator AlpA